MNGDPRLLAIMQMPRPLPLDQCGSVRDVWRGIWISPNDSGSTLSWLHGFVRWLIRGTLVVWSLPWILERLFG